MRRLKSTRSSSFRQVAIVGVGLIGGSLGLALKQRYPSCRIVGCDRPVVLKRALRRKAIDAGQPHLRQAVAGADLVVLAAPIEGILHILSRLSGYVGPNAVVTDVGSVKTEIVRKGDQLFPGGNFVGGHPMAGVELSGVDAAHPLLFENAIYVLTPARNTRRSAVQKLSKFLTGIGARVLLLRADVHDSVASAVSHLPQLAAVGLVNVVGKEHRQSKRYLQLAAGGFRDMTRIASSRPRMWDDILQHNRNEIVRSLSLYRRALAKYEADLVKGGKGLRSAFTLSHRIRTRIPRQMKGFVTSVSDVFVYLEDRPGMLAKLTASLAKAGLNIVDMELLKVREGTGGTFRISFASNESADRAVALLVKGGFKAER